MENLTYRHPLAVSSNDNPFEMTKRCLFPQLCDDDEASILYSCPKGDEEETELKENEYYDGNTTSPTSVIKVITDLANSKSTTIVMGDEGAEVALHDLTNILSSTNVVATPNSEAKGSSKTAFPTSSLDMEKTPIRTPSTCACFGFDEMGHAFIERTIKTFLEEPAAEASSPFQASCTDWQAWSYFGFGSPIHQSGPIGQSPSKENIRSALQHRASQSLKARKKAVRQLRRDLAPFGNSPARSPLRAPSLFRNRSFSVAEHRSAIVRVSKDKGPMRNTLIDVLQLCTMPENTTIESGDFFKVNRNSSLTGGGEDSVCYDSDPEDFTRRRRTPGHSYADDVTCTDNTHHQMLYPGISQSPSRALMDVHDDEVFTTIVQEIFNQTTTLVLHPSSCVPTFAGGQTPRPIAVDAWLERGQNLTYSLIQPKWMWKAKPRESNGGLKLQKSVQSVELLDVTRILKVEEMEGTDLLPFAKPTHCFVVKTIHSEEFCFEAPNEAERDRLVYSLKLVIARFGAKILVGDSQVYWEFFSMVDAGVPWNAPDLHHEAFVDRDEEDYRWRAESSDMSSYD